MKEQNRLRLERLTARHARRLAEERAAPEAEYLRAFDELRARTLGPAMEEVAAVLRQAGHDPRILLDEGDDRPSVELALGLPGRDGGHGGPAVRNRVGFAVIRWEGYPLQILAYLEPTHPRFDLERFALASEVSPDQVEQILVDAIEHLLALHAP